jgi:hypothetical protein
VLVVEQLVALVEVGPFLVLVVEPPAVVVGVGPFVEPLAELVVRSGAIIR